MPTTSVTAAVKAKYESLTAANFPGGARPPVYFGLAAQTGTAGTQIRPPYVVFTEASRSVQVLDFERNSMLTVSLVMDVYANSESDVDTICNCIRWDSPTAVGSGNGFDFGSLSDLAAPRSTFQIIPAEEPRRLEKPLDQTGLRMHACRMTFRVSVLERP